MSKEDAYNLVVASFADKNAANYVHQTLLDMEYADMVRLKSASTLYRDASGKLEVHHKHGLTTWKGAAGGIAVGFLLGGPLLGGAIGALVGRRGKGEMRDAKEFLDDKLGQNESAIVVIFESEGADWKALRDMFIRYDAELLELELSAGAEEEIARLTADEDVVKRVRRAVDVVDHTAE